MLETKPRSFAIIGTGALGGLYGGMLAKAGVGGVMSGARGECCQVPLGARMGACGQTDTRTGKSWMEGEYCAYRRPLGGLSDAAGKLTAAPWRTRRAQCPSTPRSGPPPSASSSHSRLGVFQDVNKTG